MEAKESDSFDIGAGDQGMMFGYACDETPECMPMPISYAQACQKRLTAAPEGARVPASGRKTQVTVRYENGRPAVH